MEIQRVYHPYNLWEDYKHCFYDNCSGEEGKTKKQLAIDLLSNEECLNVYMGRIIKEWFYSCEHNLTNPAMNKIAYIGQAACSLYANIPNTITMDAWGELTDEQKSTADKVALSKLKEWELKYSDIAKMRSTDNKC